MTNVSIKKLDECATVPRLGTKGAAAVDLCAIAPTTIQPGERALIQTGLGMGIPPGMAGMICSRSGLALKHGVTVLNAPGIIDSDYTGDVGVILANFGTEPFKVSPGDRVAQFMVVPSFFIAWNQVDELETTERGEGGFGSTGMSGHQQTTEAVS